MKNSDASLYRHLGVSRQGRKALLSSSGAMQPFFQVLHNGKGDESFSLCVVIEILLNRKYNRMLDGNPHCEILAALPLR